MNAKTLFAALAATSMAAVYGAVTAPGVGFESYTPGATLENGNDDAGVSSEGLTTAFFLYVPANGSEDASVVSNDVNNGASYTWTGDLDKKFPKGFDGFGSNYLRVDTEGGTLFRCANHIKAKGENDHDFGDSATFTKAKPLYIDTFVQFTVTEDDVPTLGSDDKLAIWLRADNGATNLCVAAGCFTGAETISNRFYELSVEDTEILAGNWYRLTVEATVIEVTAQDWSWGGFRIYIDGKPAYSTTNAATESGLANLLKDDGNTVIFPSLKAGDFTLTAVGFQGTGAIDDLVIDDNAPTFLEVPPISFELNWDTNVSAINLIIDGEAVSFDVTSLNYTSTNFPINAGGLVQIGFSGYNVPDEYESEIGTDGIIEKNSSLTRNWTTNDTAGVVTVIPWMHDVWDATADGGNGDLVNTHVGYEYTILDAAAVINLFYEGGASGADEWVADTTEIPANTTVATQYPTLASTAFAAVDAKQLTEWATDNDVDFGDFKDNSGDYVDAYLLNCDPADVEDEAEEFTVTITIGADGTPIVTAPDANSDDKPYNGTIQLQGATSPTGPWININAASTDYQFYKCVLSL